MPKARGAELQPGARACGDRPCQLMGLVPCSSGLVSPFLCQHELGSVCMEETEQWCGERSAGESGNFPGFHTLCVLKGSALFFHYLILVQ